MQTGLKIVRVKNTGQEQQEAGVDVQTISERSDVFRLQISQNKI